MLSRTPFGNELEGELLRGKLELNAIHDSIGGMDRYCSAGKYFTVVYYCYLFFVVAVSLLVLQLVSRL